jgi:membrane-bound serine protease (ClpP class)
MLLFLVGIVAFYVELKTPGLSVPGLIGVVCFGLFFFGHHVVGLAQAWEALVFLLGLALLAVEIFVLPGFGVAGVTGAVLMLGALVLAQVPDLWPGGAYGGVQWPLVIDALGRTTLGIALGVVGAIGLAWIVPHSPLARFVTLEAPAVTAGLHGSATPEGREAFVGKVGVAETDLRPAGRVRIGDAHFDVVSEGGYIDAGAAVTVVTTRGNALVVRGSA